MIDRLTAPDAPVTVNEIFTACGKSKRGWRKRAKREQWECADKMHAFNLAKLPDDVRDPVERLRRRMIDEAAQVHAADARAVVRHDKLPCDYTANEQALGRARADFVL